MAKKKKAKKAAVKKPVKKSAKASKPKLEKKKAKKGPPDLITGRFCLVYKDRFFCDDGKHKKLLKMEDMPSEGPVIYPSRSHAKGALEKFEEILTNVDSDEGLPEELAEAEVTPLARVFGQTFEIDIEEGFKIRTDIVPKESAKPLKTVIREVGKEFQSAVKDAQITLKELKRRAQEQIRELSKELASEQKAAESLLTHKIKSLQRFEQKIGLSH